MLPSKCPLCKMLLHYNSENNEAYCPKKKHYLYTIQPENIAEIFQIEKYEVINDLWFSDGVLIASISKIIDTYEGPVSELIVEIKGIRIPPTVTSSKLRTYIAFS